MSPGDIEWHIIWNCIVQSVQFARGRTLVVNINEESVR